MKEIMNVTMCGRTTTPIDLTQEKINVLQEISEWNTEYRVPGHTYVTIRKNQRVIGYYKESDPTTYIPFKTIVPFSTSKRKFINNAQLEKEWNEQ